MIGVAEAVTATCWRTRTDPEPLVREHAALALRWLRGERHASLRPSSAAGFRMEARTEKAYLVADGACRQVPTALDRRSRAATSRAVERSWRR
jgi:hypothetical protein